jgi:hypothetical protein
VDYAKSGAPMSLPEIGVAGRRLGFQNGRNRFAVARDNGDAMIPVVVHRDNIEDVLATVYGADRMTRARQMGFYTDMPLYHGATGDFRAFDPARAGDTSSGAPPRMEVSASLQPDVAEELAASNGPDSHPAVVPLIHRSDRRAQLELTGDEKNHEIAATLSKAWDDGYTSVLMRNYTTPGGKTPRDILVVRDPAQLRSPFAQFDPAKRNSSDLLASIAGFPVAAGVAGSAIKYGFVPAEHDAFAEGR